MLFRTTFAKILQLSDDNVFRRGEPDRFSFKVDLSLLSERPRMDLFSSRKVEIRLKASVQVDDIEMTSLLACHFHSSRLRRRDIELLRRKHRWQPLGV